MAKNTLSAGYARVDITPPLGVNIAGYYKERIADGVLDNLYACALAVSDGKNTVLLITTDLCSLSDTMADEWRAEIAEKTGLPTQNIYTHAVHTHQGPIVANNCENPLNQQYRRRKYTAHLR